MAPHAHRKLVMPLLAATLLVMMLVVMACSSEEPAPAPASEPAASAETPAASEPMDGSPAASSAPAEPVQVVTTSNIVADWARIVGGERAEVAALLPPNADPHTYQPGARDISRIADADLIFSIGLTLERNWLDDLITNAAQDPHDIVALGEEVNPIDFVEIHMGHGDEHDDHGHEEHGEEMHGDHDGHDDHGHDAMAEIRGRLLIGDGETGDMSIIELDHDEVEQNAFDLGSRAGRIYPTKSGRFAVAVSSDTNSVQIFDGGLYLEAHDDHFDIVSHEVEPVGLGLTGERPSHLYVGKEWVTVYYDGSGDVALINEHELEEHGSDYEPVMLYAGPNHGAAVPLSHDLFAITVQHPDFDSDPEKYRLPSTVAIRDLHGDVLYTADGCPDLHGDAGNGHMAVFGCTGGVLAVEADHGEYEHLFIPAPAGEPEDFRLTSVWGAYGLDHFFALGSAVGLYMIEPEDGFMEQLIPATEGSSPIQVALSQDGEELVVVMSDGEIRLYDGHDGDLVATNSEVLTTPVETGFWARPHVALTHGAIFVTDSVGGQVLQLDSHDLDEVDHWDVAGTPVKIAFVGIHGDASEHPEEGHDEHMEEGHGEHGHEEHGHEEHGEEEHGEEMHGDHDGHDDHGHHGHDHGALDPHFWFDPVRVKVAVNSIAAHLSEIDPEGQAYYQANAAAYNAELDELHAWIEAEVAVLPVEDRLIVTSHDAYQYFANRYNFRVVGAVYSQL